MKKYPVFRAILLSSIGSGLFIFLGTILNTNGFGNYGAATFITAPIMAGILSALILNYRRTFSFKNTYLAGLATVGLCYALLLLLAFEGLICLLMASPLALLAQWLGTFTTYTIIKRIRKPGLYSLALILVLPIHSVLEPYSTGDADLLQTQTEGIIKAPVEDVWAQLMAVNQFAPPASALMRAGISYPKRIHWIQDDGRDSTYIQCEYSNGTALLEVDSLIAGHVLQFSLEETPATMKEMSFYDEVHAPHLHGNFKLVYGKVALTSLPEGHTLVTTTSAYTHKIKPALYWKLWSDFAFDQVHQIVIKHLKNQTEQ